MDKNYNNEHFVRWLNNDLSAEELIEFKKSPKFSLYQKIAETSSELNTPGLDEDKLLRSIENRIKTEKQKTTKVRKLVPKILYVAVASIVLLISVFSFLNRSTTYSTSNGEQLVIVLPDASEVTLNPNSKLSFKKRNWDTNRNLQFNGEAYFKVEKGSTFEVVTTLGTVNVLGTQFNVNTKESIFIVKCFEGKVRVNTATHERILVKGQAFKQFTDATAEDFKATQEKLTWTKGETAFNNASLSKVIKAIEEQYGITIDASKINSNQKITGSYTNSNLEVALQTVFVTLKIKTIIFDEKTILLEK